MIDLASIFLQAVDSGERSKANRLAQVAQQNQLAMQKQEFDQSQADRAAKIQQMKDLVAARQAALSGDPSKLQAVAPEEYQRNQSFATTQKTAEQASAEKRATLTANLQRAFAGAGTDQERQGIAATWDKLAANGLVDGPSNVPDSMEPDQAAILQQHLRGASGAVLGPGEQNVDATFVDPIAKQVVNRYQLKPGQPGYSDAYAKVQDEEYKREMQLRKAGASQVNIGGKDLASSDAKELADAGSAVAALDSLLESFGKVVPSGSVVEQAGSKIQSFIPNSGVANFDQQSNAVAQFVGGMLEGGKLTDSDFKKYKMMMPSPGDSPETAAAKTNNLKAMIETRSSARSNALRQAGYKVPEAAQDSGTPKTKKDTAKDNARKKGADVAGAVDGLVGVTRTDPETGETRVWDGSKWVAQ